MPTRVKRSTPELIAASQHLAYEVKMLTAVAQELKDVAQTPGVLRNALLESFHCSHPGIIAVLLSNQPEGE